MQSTLETTTGQFEPLKLTLTTCIGPVEVDAMALRGLAYHLFIPAKPESNEEPLWVITHINSGLCIHYLCTSEEMVKDFLLKIVDLVDWTSEIEPTYSLSKKVTRIYHLIADVIITCSIVPKGAA